MLEKLKAIEERLTEVERQLSDPAVYADRERLTALSREQKELTPVVACYRAYVQAVQTAEDAAAMLSDPELRELAQEQGVSYQTLRNWKAADRWDEALPKKRRGGQPGNRNSAGKKNAAGSHAGAPAGNKNAEKDGAYSAVFFDMLSDAEREIVQRTPLGSRAALEHEMQILKFREHKILAKIAEYEAAPEDSLYINSLMDMRVPGGRGKDKQDGALQSMGMYSKDSAFSRVLKLQEALYKVQGRIAKIADSLRALEESEKRMTLEREKLELLRMRATGAVDVPDPETDGEDAEEMA